MRETPGLTAPLPAPPALERLAYGLALSCWRAPPSGATVVCLLDGDGAARRVVPLSGRPLSLGVALLLGGVSAVPALAKRGVAGLFLFSSWADDTLLKTAPAVRFGVGSDASAADEMRLAGFPADRRAAAESSSRRGARDDGVHAAVERRAAARRGVCSGGVEGSMGVREERRVVGMEELRRGVEGKAESVGVREVRRGVGIDVSRRGGGMREEVEARARRPREGEGEGMLDDIGDVGRWGWKEDEGRRDGGGQGGDGWAWGKGK